MPASLLNSRNLYLNSLIYEWTSTSPERLALETSIQGSDVGLYENQGLYLNPYHAAEIVDPKLESIKPSAWTSVCTDDKRMRELLNTSS